MRCERLGVQAAVRLISPSAERNKAPIAEVLDRMLPVEGEVVEVSSGTGQHIVYFAKRMPRLTWQPTECDPECLRSIEAWRGHEELPNVREPLFLQVCEEIWPMASADAVVCLNMIHIAPWSATVGLLRGAAKVLRPGSALFLYGPFRRNGAHTAPSNAEFDRLLQARNPRWGVRNLEDVESVAAKEAFELCEIHQFPANNLGVVFLKQ
jgi:hypothetical protein